MPNFSPRRKISSTPELTEESASDDRKDLFALVAQISPTGGGNFEDVAVFDVGNDNEWLVTVVTQAGDDFFIYRRIYHGDK